MKSTCKKFTLYMSRKILWLFKVSSRSTGTVNLPIYELQLIIRGHYKCLHLVTRLLLVFLESVQILSSIQAVWFEHTGGVWSPESKSWLHRCSTSVGQRLSHPEWTTSWGFCISGLFPFLPNPPLSYLVIWSDIDSYLILP